MVEGWPPLYELELRSDLPTVNSDGPFFVQVGGGNDAFVKHCSIGQ